MATPFPPEILESVFSMIAQDRKCEPSFHFETSRQLILPLLLVNKTFYSIALPVLFQALSPKNLKDQRLRQLIVDRSYGHLVRRAYWSLETDLRARDAQGAVLEEDYGLDEVTPELESAIEAGLQSSQDEMTSILHLLHSFSGLRGLCIDVDCLPDRRHRFLEYNFLVLPTLKQLQSLPCVPRLKNYSITIGDDMDKNPAAMNLAQFACSLPHLRHVDIRNVPLPVTTESELSPNITSLSYKIDDWTFNDDVKEARHLDSFILLLSRGFPLLECMEFKWIHDTLTGSRLQTLCSHLHQVKMLTLGTLQNVHVHEFESIFSPLTSCTTLFLNLSADCAEEFISAVAQQPEGFPWLEKLCSVDLHVSVSRYRPAAYIGSKALEPMLKQHAMPNLKYFGFTIGGQDMLVVKRGIQHLIPERSEPLPIDIMEVLALSMAQIVRGVVDDFRQFGSRHQDVYINGSYMIATASDVFGPLKVVSIYKAPGEPISVHPVHFGKKGNRLYG